MLQPSAEPGVDGDRPDQCGKMRGWSCGRVGVRNEAVSATRNSKRKGTRGRPKTVPLRPVCALVVTWDERERAEKNQELLKASIKRERSVLNESAKEAGHAGCPFLASTLVFSPLRG